MLTPAQRLIKSVMQGNVVAFKESLQKVLHTKANEALDIRKIRTGVTFFGGMAKKG